VRHTRLNSLVSPTFGVGGSAGLALQVSRFLLLGEGLIGFDNSSSGYFDLFFGGAGGLIFVDVKHAPYAVAGLGWLGRGNGDNRGHEVIALTLQGGAALWRSRRPGQVWIGARVFVPLVQGAGNRRHRLRRCSLRSISLD
jgi:hypothetical protein